MESIGTAIMSQC